VHMHQIFPHVYTQDSTAHLAVKHVVTDCTALHISLR